MRWWICSILCFISLSCSSSHQYSLAICSMFKNEAPWLKEWITYHHNVLKVDHFYLYNNDSTDDFATVLQPFIDQGLVELINWPSNDLHQSFTKFLPPDDAHWAPSQLAAYDDCLKNRALGKARWVAVIDI